MCAGALIWARIHSLVYAAKDPKAGAVESHLKLAQAAFSNHHYAVISGILESESVKLLQDFFKRKRQKQV